MGIAIIVPGVSYSDNNLGKVTISQKLPVTGISIVGNEVVRGESYQYTISYSPSNTSQRGVVWSVEQGSEYATINQNGLLTILQGASSNDVTIKAVSTYNADVVATKVLQVTYFKELVPIYKLENKSFTASESSLINTNKTLMDSVNTEWTLFVDLSIGEKPSNQPQSELVSIYSNRSVDSIGIGYSVYNNGSKFLRFSDGSTRKLVSVSENWKGAIRRNGDTISYSLDGKTWTDAYTMQDNNNTNPLCFGGIINNGMPGYYAHGNVVKALLYDSVIEDCSNLF